MIEGQLPAEPAMVPMQQPASQTMPAKSPMQREAPELAPAEKALVTRWCSVVKEGRKHHEKRFKQMRQDMEIARLGADSAWVENDNYVVPIIQRHINQAVASLYARNPRATAKRKKRLMYPTWDGKLETLQAAMTNPMDPNNAVLLLEIEQGRQYEMMLDRICATLEILFAYYTGEQEPNFKQRMKQLVRRVKVCGVGYLWLGFQRLLESQPEVVAQLEDARSKIARIESLGADAADGKLSADRPEVAELQSMVEDLQRQVEVIVREGPVCDFPRATEIIIDPACRELKNFIGARWIAREFHMDPDEVKDVFKIDLGSDYTPYTASDSLHDMLHGEPRSASEKKGKACVWQVWDKRNKQTFTIIDGYPGWAQAPAEPPIMLERFWPCFTLTFNDIEDEKEIFPPSDVYVLRHPQREYNSSRQGLREHRLANRPRYVSAAGAMEEADRKAIGSSAPHTVIQLNALRDGQSVDSLFQQIKTAAIDPNLYETSSAMDDVYRSVGAQEANLGGTSGSTATEASIGESSRVTSVSSNTDDLDEFLSDVARSMGQMMLLELDETTVKKLAGPGAVWPSLTRQQVVEEVELEIKAGSSGRPNRAAELANMERAMPFLIQLPGMNPTTLGKKYTNLLELDLEELIIEGLPSITAMNAMAKPAASAAPPGTSNPSDQGSNGGNNQAQPAQNEPQGQPAYPQQPQQVA